MPRRLRNQAVPTEQPDAPPNPQYVTWTTQPSWAEPPEEDNPFEIPQSLIVPRTATEAMREAAEAERQRLRESRDYEISRLQARIDDCIREIDFADEEGRDEDADDHRDRLNRTQQRLDELTGSFPERMSVRGVTNGHAEFQDFSVNNQKTQIALMRFNDTRMSFGLSVQTNRGSYRRRIVAITGSPRGLVFKRVPVRQDISHGFHIAVRQSVGDYVIVERKQDDPQLKLQV